MNQADTWYVRLPDGRTFWAASTKVVRQHLHAGRITADSFVRRSPQEEWVGVQWTEEFADLATRRSPNGLSQTATAARAATRSQPSVTASEIGSEPDAAPPRAGV